MTGPQFHETRIGRVFFEVTLPKLVEQLERLNGNLERIETRLPEAEQEHGGRSDGGRPVIRASPD
jgi:hypothetical protein